MRDFEKGIGRSVAELDLEDDDNVIRPPRGGDRAQLGVVARDVVLREGPKRSAPEIGVAKKGQALVVLREERGWVQVVHPADSRGLGVGWVPERDIEMP
ncbi:MAG: SH3 domain-containing protein [Polyangiaceae bacterium]|nr:SH3 domain-containing protein [Polyangiaceae bacterium]